MSKNQASATKDEARVVIVDDSRDAADSLATYLRMSGYEVRTAENGMDALDEVRRFKPHCVVLDINMPGMDGLELARRMRAQFVDDVVLIAITGAAATDSVVKQTFGIVDHYLQKPIDFNELDKVLQPT